VETKSSFGGSNQLEMFFPFDPYLLKHSAKYITDLYVKWTAPDEEEDGALGAFADDSSDDSDDEDDDDKIGKDDDDDDKIGKGDDDRQSSDDVDQLTQEFMHFTPDVEKDPPYHFSFD